jgi:hypothetical protein
MWDDEATTSPETPMLDVHPPHEATHTWKDFLLHIATIVIGLLIAIGLEQTVEYFHHRHQIADAREALREERTNDISNFVQDGRIFKNETMRFQTNLNVLLYIQQHPKAKSSDWPGAINWHNNNRTYSNSAWTTIQRSNITELMPQAEVRKADLLYKLLSRVDASRDNRLTAIRNVRVYMVDDFDPAHLTPSQLQDEILLAKTVLAFHYRLGGDMRNLAAVFPDFNPAPTTLELNDIMHEPHLPEYTSPPGDEPESADSRHTPASQPAENK